jgi:hypothetical protein
MEQKITSHIVKGFIIALILIIVSVIGHLANLALESWYGWIGIVIFFAAVVWSVNLYGKQMNYNVTFGNLFAHGFKVSAVIVCITFIFTLLSLYVIFPDTTDQILQKAIEEARKQNNGSSEQIEQNMDMVRKITTITILAGSVIGGLVVGVLASLIGAAATRKNPQGPFAQQPQM